MTTTAYVGLATTSEGLPNALVTELRNIKGYARQRVRFDDNGISLNAVQFYLDSRCTVEILGIFADLADVELAGHQRVYPPFHATPDQNMLIYPAGRIRIFPLPATLPGDVGAGAVSVAFNGVTLGDVSVLDFSGAQVEVTAENGKATIVIPPTPFSINSLTVTPSIAETGTIVSSVQLTWSYAALSPTQQSVNGVIVPVANRSVTLSGLNLTTDSTFTLTAQNGAKSATRSTNLTFAKRMFWGSSQDAHITDVTSFGSVLRTGVAGEYSFPSATNSYKYFVFPANYSVAKIFDVDNQFDVTSDFEMPYSITVSGQAYKAYRSTNMLNLGAWNVRIS